MKQRRFFFAVVLSVMILSCCVFSSLAEGTEPAVTELPAEDNGSTLAAFFKTLDLEKGFHITYQYEAIGFTTVVDVQCKDNYYYSTTSVVGYPSSGSFKVFSGNRLYTMNADKTGFYIDVSDVTATAQDVTKDLTGEDIEIPENIEVVGATFDQLYSSMYGCIRQTGYETLQQEVDGVTYAAEKYPPASEYDTDKIFCFDESGRLVCFINGANELFGTPAITYKLLQVEDVVDESLFDTTGFDVVDYQTYMNSLLESLGN